MLLTILQLRGRGQLAVQQQIGDFEEGAFLRQLLNGVAAIAQNAFVAIDEGDGAVARGGVHECRVVGHQAEVVRAGLDFPQVHGADGSLVKGNFVSRVGALVQNAQAVVIHALLPIILSLPLLRLIPVAASADYRLASDWLRKNSDRNYI